MSDCDDPFNPAQPAPRAGCACGWHVNDFEHARAAALSWRCEPTDAGRQTLRYGGVADAALRAGTRIRADA
jgi:hypothetical protein